jgi:sec-independent protein translocase protein TatA
VFGGHLPELVILLVVALVIFGPKRLPEIGGAMGKGIREFRKGTTEVEDKPGQIAAPPSSEAPPAPHSVEPAVPVQDPSTTPKA